MSKEMKESPGTKHDGGKLRVDLVDPMFVRATAAGLTFGANKYGDDNWRKGIQQSRVFGALLRHLYAYWEREERDPESGNHHLDHAACMLMMLIRFAKDLKYWDFDDRPQTASVEEPKVYCLDSRCQGKCLDGDCPTKILAYPKPKPSEMWGQECPECWSRFAGDRCINIDCYKAPVSERPLEAKDYSSGDLYPQHEADTARGCESCYFCEVDKATMPCKKCFPLHFLPHWRQGGYDEVS